MHGTLTGTITLAQSGLRSNENRMKGYSIFPKLQDWSLTIRCSLASYPGHSFGKGSYLSAEVQLVYSTASADRAV